MRTKVEIFDNILKTVVDMSYPFEIPFYKNYLWNKADKVVDMGCGNAEYLSHLSADNPNKTFIGVELNSRIAQLAEKRFSSNNIEILNTDYENLPGDFNFDFLIARRFMIPIFSNRHKFYNWLAKHSLGSSGVLIIDTNIDNFKFGSSLPRYSEYFQSLLQKEKKDACINLTRQIIDEMDQLGFKLVSSQSHIINTAAAGIKHKLYIYMRLTIELHLGAPIPIELDNELFDWLLNPDTYGQFEIFGTLFESSPSYAPK